MTYTASTVAPSPASRAARRSACPLTSLPNIGTSAEP